MALNNIQMERLSRLSKEELLEFIDVFQKNWWNLQNNYILYLNTEYGEEAAVKADGTCFTANAKVQMHRLRKLFGLEDDIPSLIEAQALSTIWANGEFEVYDVTEKSFKLRVTNCFQQVRRLEEGMGEFSCKAAGLAIADGSAKVINPTAEVKCLVCPPDPHPEGVWCDWEFTIK